jgi:RHS repeat-associated protein
LDEEGRASYVQAFGQARLVRIEQRSGDQIALTNGMQHYNATGALTRAIWIERDPAGRILALRDPVAGSNGTPVVRYEYYAGNLVRVHRLVDRPAATYLTTTYQYTNSAYPHLITAILDPRGTNVMRKLYDTAGRLIRVTDAAGRTRLITHNLQDRVETIYDPLFHATTHNYDERGNITQTVDALNGVTQRGYNADNNLIWEADPLTNLTFYGYDSRGNRTAMTNALGHVTQFLYSVNNELLVTIDANGHGTTNTFDHHGQLTNTVDALGNPTRYSHNSCGLLVSQTDALGTVTSNEYDSFGNLTSVTVSNLQSGILSRTEYTYDANGNQITETTYPTVHGVRQAVTITNVYDAQNRVVAVFDSVGFSNRIVYSAIGKQELVIDKLNRTNRYEYSARGLLAKVTYPDQTYEQYAYDVEGRRTNTIDRAGHSTTNRFDLLGRLTHVIHPDGTTNRTEYDAAGRVTATIDARGTVTAFGYDDAGRRTSVTNAFGIQGLQAVTRSGYDPNGNLLWVYDARGQRTDYEYDELDRLVKTIFPALEIFGSHSTNCIGYDSLGRRVAETNEAGVVTRFAYDGLGRLIAVTNAWNTADATWAAYSYDEGGQQLAQTNALGRDTRFEYDKLGRRTLRILPGAQLEGFAYDAVGNILRHTNFNGQVITNAYDLLNHLLSTSQGSTQLVTYTYTINGLRETATNTNGFYRWVYDNRDRIATNATPVGALYYKYDAAGNLTNILSSTANGVSVSYQYDALNRLADVIDHRLTGSNMTSYGFDGAGNLTRLRYPNGVTNQWQYDARNRLTNELWKLNATTLASFRYTLGAAGNRTHLEEYLNGANRANAWSYDNLYRLKQEVVSGASSGTLNYGYDLVGNRTNRSGGGFGLTNQAFSFDRSDRLDNDNDPATASTWFDPSGNTTNFAGSYRYDWADRLTNTATVTSIVYDPDGNRVKKVTGSKTTLYLVSPVNPTGYPQVLEELTVNGGATNLACAYTYGLDLISQRQPGVTTNFYGYDGLGSVRFLLSPAGTVTDTYTYDAWGSVITSSGTTTNAYGFQGERWDSDLGLAYHWKRYYHPNLGRWWTRDSWEGSLADPQSLHKYVGFQNSPVNRVDPSGEFTLTETQVATAGLLTLAVLTATAITPAKDRAMAGAALAEAYNATTDAAVDIFTGVSNSLREGIDLAKAKVKDGYRWIRRQFRGRKRMIPVLPVVKNVIPETAAHIETAQLTRPRLLRYRGPEPLGGWDRPALAGIPTLAGMARDEYPFASTMEYTAMSAWGGVSVKAVPAWEQALQGAELRWFYQKALKNKPGAPFIVVVVDVPLPAAAQTLSPGEEIDANVP